MRSAPRSNAATHPQRRGDDSSQARRCRGGADTEPFFLFAMPPPRRARSALMRALTTELRWRTPITGVPVCLARRRPLRVGHTRAMGAWGPGIFSDDVAADIRGDYRELIEDGISDEEATTRVIDAYGHLDVDEKHTLWIALAAAQSQVGRLDSSVRSRALEVIDTGSGLELWEEAGPKDLAKRKAALAKLRAQLVGPQPARKTIRRPWRHVTDLRAGQVLSIETADGRMALFRVLRIDDHRVGVAPIVEWLDWSGRSLPSGWRLRRLKPRRGDRPAHGGPERAATYRVSVHRKKDPDWGDVGFAIAAQLAPRPADASSRARIYTGWSNLAGDAKRHLSD